MGWSRPYESERADYLHDLRKHEPRPGEKDYVPHRLDVEIPTAIEIAEIVRNPHVKLTSAADLIEQYARTMASGAAAAATEEASKRFEAVLAAVKA